MARQSKPSAAKFLVVTSSIPLRVDMYYSMRMKKQINVFFAFFLTTFITNL